MANQTKGPKVEKVTKGGKAKAEKKPPKERKEKQRAKPAAEEARAENTDAKEQKKADKAAAKAARAEQKAAAKEEKARKKEAGKEERAAKKLSKAEKTKAVKISREEGDAKPAGKKKILIMAAVAVVLVLLIAVSVFFLVRLIRGGGEETTASLPDAESSSSTVPVEAGTAGGPGSSGEESTGGASEPPEAPEEDADSPASADENASAKDAPSQETSSKEEPAAEDASSAPESTSSADEAAGDPAALSKETASQAVEGSAGTASISAMLGAGTVPPDQVDITSSTPTDKPKPGQIIASTGGESETASEPSASEPRRPESDKPDKGSALTPPSETQAVPDFKFSEASLNLPPFAYSAPNALEAAVHRDIGDYLAKKDDRPGTQITSVVIGGTIRQPDGTLRVLAYAWGSRYAIADNTLFDYGNLVGPCALDYSYSGGRYSLQNITLARAGDAFESSVREFCGDQTIVADKMVSQAYDLELRGQMLRNVSGYIRENSIPVEFFRASGQVYNADGSIYLPPEIQAEQAAEAASETAESEAPASSLQEDYRLIQDMPE